MPALLFDESAGCDADGVHPGLVVALGAHGDVITTRAANLEDHADAGVGTRGAGYERSCVVVQAQDFELGRLVLDVD